MRKKLIIILLITLVILVIKIFTYEIKDENKMLINAFSHEKYMQTTSHVSINAKPFEGYYSEEEKENFVRNIAKSIGLNEEYDISKEQDIDANKTTIEINKNAKYVTTKIKLTTIEEEKSKTDIKVTNYLCIEMSIEDSVESAVMYKDKIKDALEKTGITMEISLSLSGYVKGYIDDGERAEIGRKMLEEFDGKVVEEKYTNSMSVLYGYSDNIRDCVMLLGKKVNINIAFTYDETSDETVIYMATPIINEDF